jgi:hypothetical protein
MAPALPVIAVGAALAGTAISTYSAIKQGQAASQNATFQADQAQQNAGIAINQANEDARAFSVFSRQQLGAERAGYGASGVDTASGSPQAVLENGAAQSALDAAKIKYGGQLKAAGYQNTASLSTYEASAASTGGYLSAAGTLLSGAAKTGYMVSGNAGSGQQIS